MMATGSQSTCAPMAQMAAAAERVMMTMDSERVGLLDEMDEYT